ncbi:helix-turn-helix domain-containing protein [Nocardia jiangsuensis]|uniref:Multiprotein-bridging factor 1 family protein n=1 Tax=Nocardia jiangsuensis TaxID=1691563 RepID=A0ABV8E0U8_9NOCA
MGVKGEDIRAARKARGWSAPTLIAALTEAAAREGRTVMGAASLRVAISRWENGKVRPDDFHATLLAGVLCLPYGGDPVERGLEFQQDIGAAIAMIDALAEQDHDDVAALSAVDALPSPLVAQVVTSYLFGDTSVLPVAGEPVFGVALAEQIRATVASMMSMDFQRGGGHVRRTLLRYVRTEVVPQLHAVHPGLARREIFSAAAEAAQLLGWSAYDAGRHAAAGRYFVQGLRLAQEARDHLMGARLLANLSHQANFTGRFGDAVMYARAAQSALRGHGTPAVETMCVMMEARGLAGRADRAGTTAAIRRAETSFERRTDAEPTWIGYYDGAELAGDAAHCFRDLDDAAQAREFIDTALTPATPARTAAFIQMVAGDAALIAGDFEQAASLATSALTNGADLRSARFVCYVRDFHDRLPSTAAQHPAFAEYHDLLRAHDASLTGSRS